MTTRARTATLRLRGRNGPVTVGVTWPLRDRTAGPARLMVAIGVNAHAAGHLARELDRVIVRIDPTTTLDDAVLTVRWAFAHHAELFATGDDLWVIGAGDSVAIARQIAAKADSDGWPPLTLVDLNTTSEVSG
jgi:hypothetical protein